MEIIFLFLGPTILIFAYMLGAGGSEQTIVNNMLHFLGQCVPDLITGVILIIVTWKFNKRLDDAKKERDDDEIKQQIKEIKKLCASDIIEMESATDTGVTESEIKVDDDSFFLALPPEIASTMSNDEKKNTFKKEDRWPDKAKHFKDDEGFKAKLKEARKEVADEFIDKDSKLYNGSIYGVRSYYINLKSQVEGQSSQCDRALHLDLFRTDYYTQQVMERILRDEKFIAEIIKKLSSEKVNSLDKPSKESLNDSLYWTRCSLGLSILVILPSINKIIMTYRPENAKYSEGKKWMYVSTTVALKRKDGEDLENLKDCVAWGIKKELGIDEKDIDEKRFYDCFYEKHFHQDNIIVSVRLGQNVKEEDVHRDYKEKGDGKKENNDIFFCENKKEEIIKFINENRSIMRAQTVYTLVKYAEHLKS